MRRGPGHSNQKTTCLITTVSKPSDRAVWIRTFSQASLTRFSGGLVSFHSTLTALSLSAMVGISTPANGGWRRPAKFKLRPITRKILKSWPSEYLCASNRNSYQATTGGVHQQNRILRKVGKLNKTKKSGYEVGKVDNCESVAENNQKVRRRHQSVEKCRKM